MAICSYCDKEFEHEKSNAMNDLDYCDIFCEMNDEEDETEDEN